MAFLVSFALFVVVTLITVKLYFKLTTGWCRSNVCLVGKTVIVTGANAGIGYASAEDFAKRGARVILACRDPIKGQNAAKKIIKASDNPNVVFKELDLSALQSVRDFAHDINRTEKRLDILLNSAGAIWLGSDMTDDGLLLIMATNYFGHFLLTNLLLGLLIKTGSSRIVNVSSWSAKQAKSLDMNNLNTYPDDSLVSEMAAYERTKLCNIYFTIELASRLRGTTVTTYSTHPGLVYSEVFRYFPRWYQIVSKYSTRWLAKDIVEGAQTSIYCSVEKGIESLSGEHFADCHLEPRYESAKDADVQKRLWDVSLKLVKLDQKQN